MKIEILKLFKEKKNLKFYLIDRKDINENEARDLAKNIGTKLSKIKMQNEK